MILLDDVSRGVHLTAYFVLDQKKLQGNTKILKEMQGNKKMMEKKGPGQYNLNVNRKYLWFRITLLDFLLVRVAQNMTIGSCLLFDKCCPNIENMIKDSHEKMFQTLEVLVPTSDVAKLSLFWRLELEVEG